METQFKETASGLARQLLVASVDHQAFESLIRACELVRCKGTCCYDGVYLSDEEAELVQRTVETHRDVIESYGINTESVIESARGGAAKKTVTRTVTTTELADDFPEHFAKTRCVFLDDQSRCGLQRLAMDRGESPWLYKPLTCWIHPIVILPAVGERTRPLITLVSPDNDPQKKQGYPGYASCTHCGRPDDDGKSAKDVLQGELRMLGELCDRDFVGELNAPAVDWEWQ